MIDSALRSIRNSILNLTSSVARKFSTIIECFRVLEILLIVVKANRSAMRRLYSLGAFEILLWKVLAGDLVDWEKDMTCKFLLQCHLKQVTCHSNAIYESCSFWLKLRTSNTHTLFLWQDVGTISTKIDNDKDQSLCKDSVLRLYLPDGLVLRLMSEVCLRL